MSKHIEMIIDYVIDGDDFHYSDNHGRLIRCKLSDVKIVNIIIKTKIIYRFVTRLIMGMGSENMIFAVERKRGKNDTQIQFLAGYRISDITQNCGQALRVL